MSRNRSILSLFLCISLNALAAEQAFDPWSLAKQLLKQASGSVIQIKDQVLIRPFKKSWMDDYAEKIRNRNRRIKELREQLQNPALHKNQQDLENELLNLLEQDHVEILEEHEPKSKSDEQSLLPEMFAHQKTVDVPGIWMAGGSNSKKGKNEQPPPKSATNSNEPSSSPSSPSPSSGAANGSSSRLRPAPLELTPTTDELVRQVWGHKAAKWDQFVGPDGKGDLNRFYQSDPVLKKFLGSISGKRVLDLGCGNGYLARWLVDSGADHVTGVDISPEMVEIAMGRTSEERYRGHISFEVESGSNLSASDESMDRVVSNYVLMDCADYRKHIAEMYRVLRRGGTASIVIVHPCFPLKYQAESDGRLALVWEESYFVEHEQRTAPFDRAFSDDFLVLHHSIDDYINAFKEVGFQITEIKEPHLTQAQKKCISPQLPRDFGERPVSMAFKLTKPIRKALGEITKTALTAFTEPMQVSNIHTASASTVTDLGRRRVEQNVPRLEWQLGCKGTWWMTWEEAKIYAESHDEPGWRLPTIEELWVLFQQKQVLGEDVDESQFWSDTLSDRDDTVWMMNFKNGEAGRRPVNGPRLVRCVRTVPEPSEK